jgi:hypothetical protein
VVGRERYFVDVIVVYWKIGSKEVRFVATRGSSVGR